MKNDAIRVRPAEHSDALVVLKWRNDPQTRSNSRNHEVIDTEVHEMWFQSVLNSPERHLYIGESEGALIGQVRFDLMESTLSDFEVSISLDSHMRGQGLAVPLLLAAESALIHATTARALHAWVNNDNIASQRLFQRAGYSIDGSSDSESSWWVKEINV